jgi:hypothetical protein
VVEVQDHRGHPQPARDARPLSLAPSYAVLCGVQAVTILLPRPTTNARDSWAWVLAPALALATGIAVLRLAEGGPDALALLGAVATPALAGAGRRKAPLALALWLVAWLAHGLVAQAASVALIALAAATIAELAARVASKRVLAASLVVLAILDVVLVWGTPQVEPASQALHAVSLPHGIPALQDATFGGATMGWLDFVAPALLGVAVVHRNRAAAVTGLVAGAWGMLLLVTDTVPATVPTLAGLLCAYR